MDPPASARLGLCYGLGAFGWWALVVPAYFRLLSRHGADPFELLAQRIVFGLPMLLGMLAWKKNLGSFLRAVSTPASLRVLIPSTICIALNWYFFIWAIANDRLSHASLGYYINPLVSVALGAIFLQERLRSAQWAAVVLGVCAVGVLAWGEGTIPVVSLILPLSFGTYGLLRKQAGVGPVVGLTFEMLMLLPIAAGLLVWLEHGSRGVFLRGPGWVSALMLLGGMVTVVPMVWFTSAARLLPLSTVGLMQYLAPTGQLMLSYFAFGESFPPEKWAAFGIIGVAIVLFTADALRHAARQSELRRSTPMPPAELLE